MGNKTKEFKPFKTRVFRLEEKTWAKLKKEKLKFGKSWNTFLINLLNK